MGVKFLVVDDDQTTREMIGVMIQSLGCESELIGSGKEALAILQSPTRASEFDAIFLDVMMPEMTGYEVLEKVRAQPHTEKMPIIMLTAFDKSDGFMKAFQQGADYYITKPFTKEQVVFGLDMVLAGEEAPEDKDKAVSIPEDW